MRCRKGLILILLALIFISESMCNPCNHKFPLDCMDEDNKDNKECGKVNIYTKNIYLTPNSQTLT
ncbi:hypothetical protein DP145_11545 [Clostridium tetani]|uniref:hypothetical protein n=1 Tax=Clostridium tetani TaxID=1513 RepID=UPI0003C0C53C|nr:hypothetical protein [Clostridium tetani]CDI49654.1 hypothetical protein BN906_01657 [Clostridium tetani 12124569]AVP55766.1 hypothetical protein C3B72_11715 [Clostridium tetani]QBD85050.1 hypothetical protein EQG73_07410 [Clostridium tetani]QBD87402.1 hypothetical protein EW636_07405 [Clostridium tetani]RXI38080.1 hypothetical protein DP129_12060 [Clostridium tetani]